MNAPNFSVAALMAPAPVPCLVGTLQPIRVHVNCPINTITDRSGQGGRSASLQAHLGLAAGEAIVSGVAGAPLNLIGASVNLAARGIAAAIPHAQGTGMGNFGSLPPALPR